MDVCGLYLDPPDNALVLSIDEKTAIPSIPPPRQRRANPRAASSSTAGTARPA